MLCYRCGTHVPDTSNVCKSCGQALAPSAQRPDVAALRKRGGTGVGEGAPFKPNDVIGERYLVKDVLGGGASGFVFRTLDRQLNLDVVTKVVHARLVQTGEERAQFAAAMQAARRVTHPNLARIYEDGVDGGRPFFTTQFLDGLSLRKIVDLRAVKKQVFSAEEVEPLVAQLSAALEALHRATPHGAVKPENVIVLPDLLKLTDAALGIALPKVPYVQAQRQRKADAYLAPEFSLNGDLTSAADIYALGVIVGELLTGLRPEGQQLPDLLRANPQLPMGLDALYKKACNPSPRSRFKTATELHEAFAELARPAPPPLKPRKDSGPRPRVSEEVALEAAPASDRTVVIAAASVVPGSPPLGAAAGSAPIVESRTIASEIPEELAAQEKTRSDKVAAVADPGKTRLLEPRAAPAKHDLTRPMDVVDLSVITLGGQAGGRETADGSGEGATMMLPATAISPLASAEPSRTRSRTLIKPRQKSAALLVGLTACGLLVGAVGGYIGIQASLKNRPAKPGAAAVPVTPPPTARVPARIDTPVAQASPAPPAAIPAIPSRPAVEPPPAPRAEPARAAVALSCPQGMALVPAGSFKVGTAADDPMMGFDERKLSSVSTPAFCIDQYEYPNKKGTRPTVSIAWADAKRICEAQRKRLCTEEEWEKACKGPSGLRYPYGPGFDANACNTEDSGGRDRTLAPSGQFSRCKSGYGIHDLSGNVAEWTSSASGSGNRVLKGGSYERPDYAARCSARRGAAPTARAGEVGFRCCAAASR